MTSSPTVLRSSVAVLVTCLAALALALIPAAVQAATGSSVISGAVFEDMNRSGAKDAGEPALAGKQLYLLDSVGQYIGQAYSDASGRYEFGALADGGYRVEFASPSWWSLRDNWVPTTTGSLFPKISVSLAGSATADFGWRPIVRSTDLDAPISSYVGTNGLRVNSYNDVVGAREVYDAVMRGTVGAEARFVTIRFDFSATASTVAAWQGAAGSFTNFYAVCYDNYVSWLAEGDMGVSHEYGHAWSLYYDTMVQQDGTLASYLKARGLYGDPRVNAAYAWSAREMIAEDYRQLLGSPTAQGPEQMNRDIPPASQVPGLKDFLLNTFTRPPSSPPPPPPPPVPPALAISNLAVAPSPVSRSGTVSFGLSASASVTVTVKSATGEVVRTLLSDAARSSGTVSVTWDRKNAKGQRVKAGSYQAAVSAVDALGRITSAALNFPVV